MGRSRELSPKKSHSRSSGRPRTERKDNRSYQSTTSLSQHREHSNDSYNSSCNDQNYVDIKNTYKTLCVRRIPFSFDSDAVQEYFHNEFSQFGDVDIRVYKSNERRIALITFRTSSEARNAFKNKKQARLHDRLLTVEIWDEHESNLQEDRRKVFDDVVSDNSRRRTSEINDERDYSRRSPKRANYRRSRSPIPARSSGGGSHHQQQYSRGGGRNSQSPEPLEENDPKATRTLFVGSLEPDISEGEVRDAFERYGVVEQIDIKHPNTTHAYAFVRFANVDMALLAKAEMQGNCVRAFHCKIGYGKAIISNSLYISGLDIWRSREELEHTLRSLGSLLQLDWQPRRNNAVATYVTAEAAEVVSQQLKLLSVRRPDVRLVVDFVDLEGEQRSLDTPRPSLIPTPFPMVPDLVSKTLGSSGLRLALPFTNPFVSALDPLFQSQLMRSNINDHSANSLLLSRETGEDIRQRRPRQDDKRLLVHPLLPRMFPKYGGHNNSSRYSGRVSSPIDSLLRPDLSSLDSFDPVLSNIVTMPDLDAFLRPSVWNGQLFTKNSIFKFRCLHVVGDANIGKQLKCSPAFQPNDGVCKFQMVHQAHTDASWMADAVHQINLTLSDESQEFCVLLVLPELPKHDDNNSKTREKEEQEKANAVERPLTCLVSYLRLKQRAAFLTPLPADLDKEDNSKNKSSYDYTSVLFTPSCFSLSLLKFAAPRLSSELTSMDDFLVLLLIRN